MTLGSSNTRVKRLRKLAGSASFRRDEAAFVVEGPRAVEEALRVGAELEGIFYSDELAEGWYHLISAAASVDVPLWELEPRLLRSAISVESPQGIAAIARIPDMSYERYLAGEVVVVLDEVRDPGNAGTILRSAHATGVTAAVFLPGSVDPYNPKVVRSSAGSIFFLACLQPGSKEEFLKSMQGRYRLVGTSADAPVSCFDADLTGAVALVVGNEGAGVSEELSGRIDEWVRIPMADSIESLNAGVAVSVLLFESLRQRGGIV